MTRPNRFTCEEVFARLDDFVDRELSAEEMRLVQEHLDTCAACAGEHRFESGVLRDVREKIVRIDVPADFLVRLSQRIAAAERDAPGG